MSTVYGLTAEERAQLTPEIYAALERLIWPLYEAQLADDARAANAPTPSTEAVPAQTPRQA